MGSFLFDGILVNIGASSILEYLSKFFLDILATPAFTLAIVTAIGLIALKKHSGEIFSGFLKTFLGVALIISGSQIIGNGITPLNEMLVEVGNFEGIYTLEEVTTAAAMPYIGMEIGGIFGLGFLFHLILARVLPWKSFKSVYLTGHAMLTMAGMIGLVLQAVGIRGGFAILLGAVMLAFYLTISCAMVWPFVRMFTNDQWNIGHTQSFWLAVSVVLAKFLGNKERDAEKINYPKSLEFLKQPGIMSALIMILVYIIVSLFVGPSFVESELSNGTNFIVWCLMQGVLFGAGIEIILFGVRMFIGEIVPAFEGIREKIIPNAVPGLDVPTLYPFAPTAMMIGVLVMLVTTLGATLSQIILNTSLVVLPNTVYVFFVGATTGIIANKMGGIRGIIIACVVSGIAYMYVPLAVNPFLGLDKLGIAGVGMSADCGVWGILYGSILRLVCG